jgi:hypothetical protein
MLSAKAYVSCLAIVDDTRRIPFLNNQQSREMDIAMAQMIKRQPTKEKIKRSRECHADQQTWKGGRMSQKAARKKLLLDQPAMDRAYVRSPHPSSGMTHLGASLRAFAPNRSPRLRFGFAESAP